MAFVNALRAGGELPRQGSGAFGATRVVPGTPAVDLGLVAGDTITAIDSTAVASSADLSSALSAYGPGDRITVQWTDAAGAQHSGSVALIAGAAD